MLSYMKSKTDVAQFVENTIPNLKPNSRLTMSILPAKSEGCYVLTAITELSEDTEKELELFSSMLPPNTSIESTQDG